MEFEDMEIVRVELKYCERCGGLWIRAKGTGELYCPPCAVEMSELPATRKRRKPHSLGNDHLEIKGQWEDLSIICGEGGNA